MVTALVLVDFSNAFNAVDHDLLLASLDRLNISLPALNWFTSYLRGRRQAIRCDQTLSNWCDLDAGVPQGSILSPLLFSIFINLATPYLKCSYHLYADDLQLYGQAKVDDLHDCIDHLNVNLRSIQFWSERFGIAVNPNKCQAIIVGSSRQITKIDFDTLPQLKYNDCGISFSSTVNDLGLVIDQDFNWDAQIEKVSRKFYASLHSLLSLKNVLPISTKISIANSLLIPIINYADTCYLDAKEEHLNKLERLLNTCIRFIFGLRKYDHVSEFRAKLNWLPIRDRRNLRIVCLLYSIITDPNTPSYLKSMIHLLSDNHDRMLRSSNNLLLSIPLHHSGFVSNSFSVVAVRLWNELPDDVRKAPSRNSFKYSVHRHYLSKNTQI